jgi:hypothetical protein
MRLQPSSSRRDGGDPGGKFRLFLTPCKLHLHSLDFHRVCQFVGGRLGNLLEASGSSVAEVRGGTLELAYATFGRDTAMPSRAVLFKSFRKCVEGMLAGFDYWAAWEPAKRQAGGP